MGGKTSWLNETLHLKMWVYCKNVNKQRKCLEMELGTSLDRMLYLTDFFIQREKKEYKYGEKVQISVCILAFYSASLLKEVIWSSPTIPDYLLLLWLTKKRQDNIQRFHWNQRALCWKRTDFSTVQEQLGNRVWRIRNEEKSKFTQYKIYLFLGQLYFFPMFWARIGHTKYRVKGAVMSVSLTHLEAITRVNHRVNPYLMRFPAQFF